MKPADFFIGVMEVFAILVPGAVLVYLLLLIAPGMGEAALHPFKPASEIVKLSAYGVAAYVSGHLLHHLGSVLDDWYDRGFARYKRRFADEPLFRHARAIVRADLGEDLDGISTFEWAGSWVRAHSDAAGAELERAGADSKFFRSLCILAAFGTPVFLAQFQMVAAVGSFALSWFSYQRFCKRRWDTTHRTYEYFVMLRGEMGTGPVALAAAMSPVPATKTATNA